MCSTCALAARAEALIPAAVSAKKVTIDPMKHDIQEIYTNNFDNVIGTALPLTVSAVWYYNGNSREDASFLDTWNAVATKSKSTIYF